MSDKPIILTQEQMIQLIDLLCNTENGKISFTVKNGNIVTLGINFIIVGENNK